MSDTTFPPSLTRSPRLTDMNEEEVDVVLRSEMEVGPAKLRRRLTGGVRKFDVSLDLTRTQLTDVFIPFFVTTTLGGSLSFLWKNPRTGAAADFRFLEKPTYKPRAPRADGGEWWIASFKVEMLPSGVVGTAPEDLGPMAGGGSSPGYPGGYAAPEDEPIEAEDIEPFPFVLIREALPAEPDPAPPILYPHFGGDGLDTFEDEDAIENGASLAGAGRETVGGASPITGSGSPVIES